MLAAKKCGFHVIVFHPIQQKQCTRARGRVRVQTTTTDITYQDRQSNDVGPVVAAVQLAILDGPRIGTMYAYQPDAYRQTGEERSFRHLAAPTAGAAPADLFALLENAMAALRVQLTVRSMCRKQ